jgi:hypothetical protein
VIDSLGAVFRVADGAYFATAGIRVRRGRAFDDADVAAAARDGAVDVPAVVSAALARRGWPRGDAIGQRFTVFKQASGRADFGAPIRPSSSAWPTTWRSARSRRRRPSRRCTCR